MPRRTACSLACLAGLLAATAATAQTPGRAISFSKPAGTSRPQASPPTPAVIYTKPVGTYQAPQPTAAGPTLHLSKPVGASAPQRGPVLPAVDPAIVRTAFQQPTIGIDGGGLGQDSQEYQIQLQPPGLSVFQLDSEKQLQERMRQEARQRPVPERISFPDEPVVSRERFPGRFFPPSFELAEPAYVCYKPLLFEERNAERYGWDLGAVQPLVSAGYFFFDVARLPFKIGSACCCPYECSTGYCLPGDPVPYRIFPPGMSFTGTMTQVATVVVLLAIFP